jgi:hypothetical protein
VEWRRRFARAAQLFVANGKFVLRQFDCCTPPRPICGFRHCCGQLIIRSAPTQRPRSQHIFTPLKLFNYLSLRVMLFFQTPLPPHSKAANELRAELLMKLKVLAKLKISELSEKRVANFSN